MNRLRALTRALTAATTLTALLVGIPYVLLHQARRWQPTAVPGWDSVTGWLASPYDTVVLLQLLDAACWLLWLWLALQTASELLWYAAHTRDFLTPSGRGTLLLAARRTLAGMLIAALVLGLAAALRTTQAPSRQGALGFTAWSTPLAAAAPAIPVAALRSTLPAAAHRPMDTRSCTVRAGDTLWDLAARHLSDPERWPEIYQLNAHRPQADGQALTDPDLIYPGWNLRLPSEAAPAPVTTTPPHAVPSPASPPPKPTLTTTSPPAAPASPRAADPNGTPSLSFQNSHTASTPSRTHGIELTGTGGYLALSLSLALSATAATVTRRRRRSYQPQDLTTPSPLHPPNPEESSLLNSLRRSTALHPDAPAVRTLLHGRLPMASGPAATGDEERTLVELLAGQSLPVLALAGEGVMGVARALLVAVLADPTGTHRLIVNREDLALLLSDQTPATGPGVEVTDSPQASIDALEEALLRRARHSHEHGSDDTSLPTGGLVILLGLADTHTRPRLSALLAASRQHGLAAVLLHPTLPTPTTADALLGAAFRVAADGQAARLKEDGSLSTPLRMFHLPVGSTETLCTLLAHDREFRNLAAGDHENEEEKAEASESIGNGAEESAQGTKAAAGEQLPAKPEMECRSAIAAPPRALKSAVALLHQPSEPCDVDGAVDKVAARHDAPDARPEPMPSPLATASPDLRNAPVTVERCPVQVRVMGPLQVRVRDTPLTKGMTGAPGELLAYLTLHPTGAGKDAIEEALWPERTPEKREEAFNTAKKTLRKNLREALGTTSSVMFIIGNGTHLRLDPQYTTTDYTAFQTAVRQSRTAPAPADRLHACRTVADLYTGTLCAGSDFDWATALREDARRCTINALSTLATASVTAGDPDRAVHLLTEALAHDPHSEELHLRQARLHAARGENDAVRRLLDQLTANLRAIGERTTHTTTTEFHTLLRAPSIHRPGPSTQRRPAR